MRPRVADLEEQRVPLAPDPDRPPAASVADAVRASSLIASATSACRAGSSPPRARERRRSAGPSPGARPRTEARRTRPPAAAAGRRTGSRLPRAEIGVARRRLAPRGEQRVVSARGPEHVRVEALDVVGAKQREVGGVGEGEVEQRLVVVALGQLGLAAPGPDRLADAPDRAAVLALGDEVAPGRDDAGRVASEGCHVGEADGSASPPSASRGAGSCARRGRRGSARRRRGPRGGTARSPPGNRSPPHKRALHV